MDNMFTIYSIIPLKGSETFSTILTRVSNIPDGQLK